MARLGEVKDELAFKRFIPASDAWGQNQIKYSLLVYCTWWMMNGCFNGKELIGTERKPAVPECEVNTYQEAAAFPEVRKMLKLEGCSTWAGAESR